MSRKGILVVWPLIGLIALLIAACGGGESAPTATAALAPPTNTPAPTLTPTLIPSPTPAPTLTPTPIPTPTPAPTPTPTPIPTPTPPPVLTPSQVFALVSPSVAFIETPIATGSAILIDGGYLLTNSHVVHGFDQVRVVFPDGSEFLKVPVKNSDDLIDLAVLGPIDTDLKALNLHGREDLAIGSEVLLVGYPAESEEFPQPTITRGILSRIREWEAIGMTYFQTDAALTGGQSGGALVSELGEIIGISGLRFSDVDFGLVASAADLEPLANALIQGRDASALGSRPLPSKGGSREHEIFLPNPWDVRRFNIDAPIGSTVELELDGLADGAIAVIDPFGFNVLFADLSFTGNESGSFTIETQGQYSVVVALSTGSTGLFTLSGSVDLVPGSDPDDGAFLIVGDTVTGNIDSFGDQDYFVLFIEEGQTVEIRAESLNIDPVLVVAFPGSRNEQIVSDDDSGIGILGTDAAITYRAIKSESDYPAGTHYLVVSDATGFNTGGYFISVTKASAGATAPEIPPSYKTVDSPFGPMIVFVSADSGYSVQAPADWTPMEFDLPNIELNVTYRESLFMGILVEDLVSAGVGERTLQEYSDVTVSNLSLTTVGFELISQNNVQTAQGLDAVRLEFTLLDGVIHANRLIIINENKKAINITVQAISELSDDLVDLIDHVFESFRVE